jgi:formylglycine-generating enzyme required for sulfatase activity
MKTVLFAVISFAAMLMASAPCHAVDENLVRIKGGIFTMGSPSSEIRREKDEASHSVTLGDFHIGKYEVTQKEYKDITGADPSNFKGDNLPVENVTWHEAVQYCNARSKKEGLTPAYTIDASGADPAVAWNKNANGYRLPTEAEWEYASRAGTTTPFNTGGNISPKQANYYGTYPYNNAPSGEYRERTVPVGSFAPNPWGLHDMHGNVWEWCWDRYGEYPSGVSNNLDGAPSGVYRVNRGGGWNDFGRHLRSAYRAAHSPVNRTFNLGFRVVRNAN